MGVRRPGLFDFWYGVVAAIFIGILRRVFISIAQPYCEKALKSKYVGEDRIERARKSATNFYKSFYYFATTIFGYYVIRDLDCLHPMMGG